MKTHYIYSKKTGQIVHVHISDDGQDISKNGILHKIDSSIKKSEVEILTTDEMIDGHFYVDVAKKKLVKDIAAKKASGGFGFSEQSFFDSDYSTGKTKTIYKKA